MLYILLIYLGLSFAIFLIPEKFKKYTAFIIAILQLSVFAYFFRFFPKISNGEKISLVKDWIPDLNLNFSFLLDGLSFLFVLLVTFIGFLVFLYAKAYMKGYSGTSRFYFYLTLFSGAMLGLVLSENMIQLFVFWELTSVLSFLLISFFNEKIASRKAAFQSLFVTGFGGLSLLAGLILLGSITDSYSITDWIQNSAIIKTDSKYLPALILILLGVFTKSAQFPFHFWLPGAMQAPTPVSSYLHSATMVKAGIFLLFRLNPVLGGTTEWTYIIPVIGVITMLTGSYLSITQKDLKAVLAYTTISALGVLVLLIGIDTKISIKAAFIFLFVHAFYKAALFMLAGFIDKKTGTRDIDSLGGLIFVMPIGFIVGSVALFSMAGIPPMLGFIGKELIYEAKVQSPGMGFLVLILGVASNIFMVIISLVLMSKAFFGQTKSNIKQLGLNEGLFLVGPIVLAMLSVGFGVFPDLLSNYIEPALQIVTGDSMQIKLKIGHGFNEVFFLSLFTVLSGIIVFYLLNKYPNLLYNWRSFNSKVFSIDFADLFSYGIASFNRFSENNTKLIQHGYHRYYILTIILFTTVLLWFQVYITRGWQSDMELTLRPLYITGLIAIIIISALYCAFAKSRLATIIAMGVTGYGISFIYLYYSAVDLAITQIIVETLTVVLFVLVLQKLPKFAILSRLRSRMRDAVIALAFGSVMTILALKAIDLEFNRPISDYYIENSYLKAYGKNVVNVILVDFRALDTLGEVTVLTIASLGVFVLLKSKKEKR